MEQGFLQGVRVVDFSRLLPGPFCTMLLGDLGADVLKVEEPGIGDHARHYPPLVDGVGAFFAATNRNKRSVTLNLKAPEAQSIARELAAQADVVVESFRPGVMARMGLDAESLMALNPRLIYCAITGYGQDGPMAHKAGHDLNFMARSGLLDHNGARGEVPVVPGFQLADLAGGALYAALGILAALYRRERTGQGAFLDISMTEGALSLHAPMQAMAAAGAPTARGEGLLGGSLASYRIYETADGRHLAVAALELKFWEAFVLAIGLPELSGMGLAQGAKGQDVAAQVAAVIARNPLAHWEAVFATLDACVEPVRRLEDVVADEVFRARGVFFELAGVRHMRTPMTPREMAHGAPPALGEATEAVLAGLGRSALEIADLRARGVI